MGVHRANGELDNIGALVWPFYIEARKPRWSTRTYLDHVKLADDGGQAQKRNDRKTIPGSLASLLDTPLSALHASRITGWLEAEQATCPTSTSLSYRMLRAFMRWAENIDEYRGIVPADAYSARSVREATRKVKPKVGDCLQREQRSLYLCRLRYPSRSIEAEVS